MLARVRIALLLAASALFTPSYGQSVDWTLTDAQLARLHHGAVLVDTAVVEGRPPGEIRAAVQVHASAERVFRTLTNCAEALRFVPHLEHCAVLETAPDGSWQTVEHRVDPGWFAPTLDYVFRAEYEPFRRIRFSNVRGDLSENRGVWEFRPIENGAATIVTYRVYAVPRVLLPRWLLRRLLRRDLPALLKGLRACSESGESGRVPAAATAGPAP